MTPLPKPPKPFPRGEAAAEAPVDEMYADAASLREALAVFQRQSEVVTRAHGLTPRSYQLLLMIKTARAGNGLAGLLELEERLQLGKSTVTELVLRTEKRGFVRRELDRQRQRGIAIRLTPVGERRLAKAVRALGDERSQLLQTLTTIRK